MARIVLISPYLKGGQNAAKLAQLRQKRIALGHKPDDHEPEQQQGFSMKFHM